jgi:hypothetical protein
MVCQPYKRTLIFCIVSSIKISLVRKLDKNANACYNAIMKYVPRPNLNYKPKQGLAEKVGMVGAPLTRTKEKATLYGNRRLKLAATVAGLGLALATGKVVESKVSDFADNRAQPVCEVPVQRGDTISGIESRLKAAGDDVRGEKEEVWTHGPNSRQRTPDTDPNDFYVNGQMGMQAGDTLKIEHVDPNACLEVGGFPTDPETGSHK